jgi:hypothetical protein
VAARISRSPWLRRRRGVQAIKFFEYSESTGLNELTSTIRFDEWFEGRSQDPLTAEEIIIVKLINVTSSSLASLAKVDFVQIDGKYHNANGERDPEGAGSNSDYVLRVGAKVVSV